MLSFIKINKKTTTIEYIDLTEETELFPTQTYLICYYIFVCCCCFVVVLLLFVLLRFCCCWFCLFVFFCCCCFCCCNVVLGGGAAAAGGGDFIVVVVVVVSLKIEQVPGNEGNECNTEECYLSRCQQQTPQGKTGSVITILNIPLHSSPQNLCRNFHR